LETIGNIDVGANLAHIYTECARIFNPIHTDVAHAKAVACPTSSCTAPRRSRCRLSRLKIEPARVRRNPLPLQRNGA